MTVLKVCNLDIILILEIEKGIFTYDDTKHNFYLSDEEDNVEYLKYNCVSKSKQDPVRNNEILQTKKVII